MFDVAAGAAAVAVAGAAIIVTPTNECSLNTTMLNISKRLR